MKKNILIVILVYLGFCGISLAITSFFVKLLSMCFGFPFSFKLAIGIWIVIVILKDISGAARPKK